MSTVRVRVSAVLVAIATALLVQAAEAQWFTVEHQGRERRYLLRVPPGPREALPLVLVFHGGSVTPESIADIYQLAGQLRRNAEAIARPHAQSQARWHVLSAASADPKTVPQIARRLGVGRQNVQRIADLLVEEGLASFENNPDHRTSPYLILTDAGRAVLRQLMDSARAYHEELATGQSGADLALLHRGLRRFCDALDRHENGLEPEA